MSKSFRMKIGMVISIMVAVSSCATAPERTAPCKRPSMVSAFAEPADCQDGGAVNGSAAIAAINQMLVQ